MLRLDKKAFKVNKGDFGGWNRGSSHFVAYALC